MGEPIGNNRQLMKSDYMEIGRNVKSPVLVAGVPSFFSPVFCLPTPSPFTPAKQAEHGRSVSLEQFGYLTKLTKHL